MAATIRDVPMLAHSLVDKDYLDIALDVPRVLKWQCNAPGGCNGIWKESTRKRAKYTLCPECEPHRTRKAVVTHPDSDRPKSPSRSKSPSRERAKSPSRERAKSPSRERAKSPSKGRVKAASRERVAFGPMVTCPICYLDYPSSEMTTCEWCGYQACGECTKMYILGLQEPAKCMNVTSPCERPHTAKWLVDNFGRTWYENVYRPHLHKIAIDAERAKIPELMAIIPAYREVVRLSSLEARALKRYKACLSAKCPKAELNRLKAKTKEVERSLDRANERVDRFLENGKIPDDTPQEMFVQGCTVEGCNGLVSATDYKCKVCGTEICRNCRVKLVPGQSHTCKPEDIETVKELAVNTRPCPKCAAPVFKVDGCDQMWCVKCHTAFDWVTNRIITGPIHNPEFFRWMREHRNNVPTTAEVDAEADRCELDEHHQEQLATRLTVKLEQLFDDRYIADVAEMLQHLAQVPRDAIDLFKGNSSYEMKSTTLKYLIKEITEKEWIATVIRLYYKNDLYDTETRANNALGVILTEIVTHAVRALYKLPNNRGIIDESAKNEAREIVKGMMESADQARLYINQVLRDENYMILQDFHYELLNSKWEWRSSESVPE